MERPYHPAAEDQASFASAEEAFASASAEVAFLPSGEVHTRYRRRKSYFSSFDSAETSMHGVGLHSFEERHASSA